MTDYESSMDVGVSGQQLFDYLADIDNLPRYFDRMTSATAGAGDAVEVTADLNGTRVRGEAWFVVSREERTLRWGSEGENDYHGHLEVITSGSGSTVRVVLSTNRAAGPEIQAGLDATVQNVKQLVEADRVGS